MLPMPIRLQNVSREDVSPAYSSVSEPSSPTFDHERFEAISQPQSSVTPRTDHVVVHRVQCRREGRYHAKHKYEADFFDVPRLLATANRTTPLHGLRDLHDIEAYLDDHDFLSFTVYHTYDCEKYCKNIKDAFKRQPMPYMDEHIASQARPYFFILEKNSPPAKATSSAMIFSNSLNDAMDALHNLHPQELGNWRVPHNLRYPYTHLFSCKHLFTGDFVRSLNITHQTHLKALAEYFDHHLTHEYEEAEELFQQGLVNRKHWSKLFRPNKVVVTVENGQPLAYVSEECPVPDSRALNLTTRSWKFDGVFSFKVKSFTLPWPSTADIVPIKSLQVYPLRFAEAGLEDRLRQRGARFWTCRKRNFVSYNLPLQGVEIQKTNLRYMVDMTTYKLMHATENEPPTQGELDDDVLNSDEPPTGDFTLLLPATIQGFGFHNKKWSMLLVEHIHDVQWNKEAFDYRLVLDETKKDLIKAVVTVHINKGSSVRADFMEGKGEGLIILLHGGPGTGKTLTAETVAEYAERPLYRVTCGDIGTDAEAVENYLQSVLFIGTTWGCVVLLDEADVFLEERTKMDLQRNALVSVFLRVLEYYDGILVLTTNRIGTFDSAFKSRIQLALHYPALTSGSRWEIWNNFVKSLSESNEDINKRDIMEKLDALARHELNGRQIRNAINTARQLARYKKETLRYQHIHKAVEVVNDFEKYVLDVHGHTDEENARALGER